MSQDPRLLGLLRQAKLCPEEDRPRLVLADWLDDLGEHPRAELVRLQLRLAPGAAALDAGERAGLESRCRGLVNVHGGAWLGPLWRYGPAPAAWHRGLLCLSPPRRVGAEAFTPVLPWLDTVVLDVTGRESLRRAVGLLARAEVNHVSLALKLPLPEAGLLDALAGLPESPCLRSFTFSWPLRLLRRAQGGGEEPRRVPAVSAGFLLRLLKECPLGRHLSHLGSPWPFDAAQAALIRRLGVEPADGRQRLWMHELSPASFRSRHGG
jgi:uncharacterized protein (TIGR02996 family)